MHTAFWSAENAELSSLYMMLATARLWFSSSSQYTANSLCQKQAIGPYILIYHRSLPHVAMMVSAMLLTTSHADLWCTLKYNNINNQFITPVACIDFCVC